jgi:hypothetical protein
VFVDTNIEELANNTSKIKVAEDSLNLENTFEKYLTLGYTDKNIIEIS